MIKELDFSKIWKSARISGRGALHIDIKEVANSDEMKVAREKAEKIVKGIK